MRGASALRFRWFIFMFSASYPQGSSLLLLVLYYLFFNYLYGGPEWTDMGYPLHSGDPNILWLGSRGLGVPVGDDRSIRRWVHGHCLLHKAVEEFSPAA